MTSGERSVHYLRLVTEDWRVVLRGGGLADEGWRARLKAELPDP